LVFKYIVDRWVSGRDHSLRHRIEDWIETMGIMQQIPNLSGNLTTGGLGEPKFEANLTAFTG
jgi:glucoamylase